MRKEEGEAKGEEREGSWRRGTWINRETVER